MTFSGGFAAGVTLPAPVLARPVKTGGSDTRMIQGSDHRTGRPAHIAPLPHARSGKWIWIVEVSADRASSIYNPLAWVAARRSSSLYCS